MQLLAGIAHHGGRIDRLTIGEGAEEPFIAAARRARRPTVHPAPAAAILPRRPELFKVMTGVDMVHVQYRGKVAACRIAWDRPVIGLRLRGV
jgi:hypothetical protein